MSSKESFFLFKMFFTLFTFISDNTETMCLDESRGLRGGEVEVQRRPRYNGLPSRGVWNILN